MRYLIISIFFLIAIACKQKKTSNITSQETNILPYTAILLEELKLLDSTPSATFKYNLNEKGIVVDSSIIDKKELRTLAKAFLDNPIDDKNIKNSYTETSYQDATIEQNNFTYTTTEKNLPIKSLTISFKSNQASTFSALQITKEFNEKNIPIRQQLYWESNRYFLITTIKDSVSIPNSSTIKVVWH
jgi:hypothetical protein